jgi:arylsulfatase A-like enzyme
MDVHAPYLAPKPYRHTYASASLSTAEMRRLAALSVRGKDYHMGRLTVTPQEFDHLRDLYDEEVLYTDARLAEVIDHLRQTGDLENTLVIVVSDHGENIGDHGLMAHRFSLHQTLLHIPFIIRYPPAVAAGAVEPAYVQLTDVLPTILSAVGRPDLVRDLKLDGVNLLGDALEHDRPALAEYLSTDYTAEARTKDYDFENSPHNRTLRAFYRGSWKLIESQVDQQHELYDLARDPSERHNVAREHPEIVSELRRSLSDFVETRAFVGQELQHEELALDRSVEERLKALGYLG